MKKLRKQDATTRQNRRIREGDTVVVIAGADKGRTGTILRRVGNSKVVVQGLNVKKKHVRPTQENQKGGINEIEMAFNVSNVMLCDDNGKGFRPKVRFNANGDKELVRSSAADAPVHRVIRKAK